MTLGVQNIPTRPRARGFSLIEILFAVMVLGIGFIMIAGMFPVAIKQTQISTEQTAGAAIGSGACNTVERAINSYGRSIDPAVLPDTSDASTDLNPLVLPLNRQTPLAGGGALTLWQNVRRNLIVPDDERLGWTPLYSRRKGENYAQIYVFVTQVRNRSVYTPGDTLRAGGDSGKMPATLEPRGLAKVTLTRHNVARPQDPDILDLSGAQNFPTDTPGNSTEAVGSGAYVIISQDTTSTHKGYCNGWIFRVGNAIPTGAGYPKVWELLPGGDFGGPLSKPDPGPNGAAILNIEGTVYVVGRGQADPANITSPYSGAVQDVAAYTTFIRLR